MGCSHRSTALELKEDQFLFKVVHYLQHLLPIMQTYRNVQMLYLFQITQSVFLNQCRLVGTKWQQQPTSSTLLFGINVFALWLKVVKVFCSRYQKSHIACKNMRATSHLYMSRALLSPTNAELEF